jgi:hypothetical protein
LATSLTTPCRAPSFVAVTSLINARKHSISAAKTESDPIRRTLQHKCC